ncbi:MAG: DUF2889 domain-containing protein [Thermodesulfobacteriota bacterium]
MTLKDRKREKVHSRKIDIASYTDDAGQVIVEGVLHDHCPVTRYLMTGETRAPGTIHELVIRMAVAGPQLAISDIEVEMPAVPRQECRQAVHCLDPLIGMPIESGFTIQVKQTVGGPRGCAHLVALLLAMAPAAVQGTWSAVSRKPMDPSAYAEQALDFLTDTCLVWAKNGPLEKQYREKLKALKK